MDDHSYKDQFRQKNNEDILGGYWYTTQTRRQWNGVKELGDMTSVGYSNVGYLSYPHTT